MKTKTFQANRLHLLDEYRGILLISMIFYHAVWDLVYIFGHTDWMWFRSEFAHFWQQATCWGFIFLSGFCWQMSKNPIKRGLLVFGSGLLVTLATVAAMPSSRVIFGVLTLLGSSMLLMFPLHQLLKNVHPLAGILTSFLLFLFIYPVNRGYLGFFDRIIIELPAAWYTNLLTTYLGFPEAGFFSTDYFSILPWFLLFVTGYFAYRLLMHSERAKAFLRTPFCPPLGWIGRHSLAIYMLHQPAVYALLFLFHALYDSAPS